uniref:Uncharacterized protein n=1 Tax=Anguilla anguilla TaxID=7936 RepID=A0A0E9SAP4_ANGAN
MYFVRLLLFRCGTLGWKGWLI